MSKHSNPFLNPEWLQLQQAYLEKLARGPGTDAAGAEQPSSDQPDWQRAMQEWLDAIAGSMPDDSRGVFNNVMGQCRSYYSMHEQFIGMFRALAESGQGDNWEEILSRHIELMKRRFRDGLDAADSEGMHDALKTSQEFWRQAARMLSPEEFLQSGQDSELQRLYRQYLSLPALGPLRQYQDKIRECLQAWQDYQHRNRDYQLMLQRLGLEAIDRLHGKILQAGREEKTIDSLRQLYDLWIDSNEEVFSEYALGEEYAVLYGELVAALMDFRRRSQAVMDELLQYLDLPDQSGRRQLQRLQSELREALQESADENRRMREEVEALKQELRALRSQEGGPDEGGA